ncbi:PREDICTED: putative F-box protein At4g10190 [Camelina sativa]|uniref:F-box protein At4g10190 n=1 Tax=Camelina sativa TaxID=90675 RepID=A0ABM0U888_CAMSA|nr:PREDICTED: putative F-box protein At4g10190 [Camelina sativa]
MMKERGNIRDLPDDLVVEILSRVPVVSLVRLRSTSKTWNVLIKDGRISKKHDDNAPRPRHSLIIMLIDFRLYLVSVDLHSNYNNKVKIASQFSLKDPVYASLKEVDIRHVFHCDGLLLCTTLYNRLVVWNLCSNETKWIQPRHFFKESDIFALGKSSCKKYKILRINQSDCISGSVSILDCEIYDFTSNSWRVVGKTRSWFIPEWKGCRNGMSVNGNTYWLAALTKHWTDFILRFDFSTERFVSVSLPIDDDHLISLSVTREDQKLCILATRAVESSIGDVWIATKIESTGAASWSKFLSLNSVYRPFSFDSGLNFLVDKENKVLVCRGKNGISDYFLHVVGEDNKCIQVDHHDAESTCSLVFSYVPTLVQIQ